MDGARPNPLSDEALDRELTRLLAVDHAPDFAARVRERIASEPRATSVWPWQWIAIAGSTALAGLVLAMTIGGLRPAPAALVRASRGSDVVLLPPAARPPALTPSLIASRRPAVAPRGSRGAVGEDTAGSEPTHEVLIPPGEQRAFAQLVAMLGDERTASAIVDARPPEEGGSDVAIAPIEITPLPNPAQQLGE